MGYHELNEESVAILHKLADLQHPHLVGDNHTRTLINKVYNREKLSTSEAFDCGKYYQRMLEQLSDIDNKSKEHHNTLNSILAFKWSVK
jgi:hypothetical protein